MKLRYFVPALALLLAGCADDDPTSPAFESRILSLLGGLEVGEAITLDGSDVETVFLPGGTTGAEYVVVPFFAAGEGEATVALEIEGANLRDISGSVDLVPVPPDIKLSLSKRLPPPDERFHLQLRERESGVVNQRLNDPVFRQKRDQILRNMAVTAAATPQVGEVLTLRVPNQQGEDLCEDPLIRPARVQAVSDHAIVVADTLNPAGGFTPEEFQRIAEEYDDLVYPVNVRNFGEPTDIDDNNRVIIFFTSAVNELTPPNAGFVIGGFFFGGDLFPRLGPVNASCTASNQGEIFYILAPDPAGEINENIRETEDVAIGAVGVIGHELQHLINLGRRIFVNNADVAEAVWLNEGLSHIAEELLFFETTRFEPRQNITFNGLISSDQIVDALIRYQVDNLVRYAIYVENPDAESLIGQGELPTRGASWAFLRYAADQEEGADEDFFFALVNSTVAGIENLNEVLSVNARDLMQTWTLSVFTDDAGFSVEPILRQPSWNYRSILSQLFIGIDEFPLAIRRLSDEGTVRLNLKPGGAAFVRFGVTKASQADIVTTVGGGAPPGNVRISIVRTR